VVRVDQQTGLLAAAGQTTEVTSTMFLQVVDDYTLYSTRTFLADRPKFSSY
jgi:hypothetical protein